MVLNRHQNQPLHACSAQCTERTVLRHQPQCSYGLCFQKGHENGRWERCNLVSQPRLRPVLHGKPCKPHLIGNIRGCCLLQHLHCPAIAVWFLSLWRCTGTAISQRIHVFPQPFSRSWRPSVALADRISESDELAPLMPTKLPHPASLQQPFNTFLLESKPGCATLPSPKPAFLFTSEQQVYWGGQLIELCLWPVWYIELKS